MWYLNCTWSLGLAFIVVNGPSFQSRDAQQRVNLGRLESSTVSVSSVNGKREQNNPYYGARNLVDGGRNLIDGTNYTTWLSDQDASHWIRLEFRNPVDIQSIMLELTALSSRSTNIISELEPTTTRSTNPHRPQEVALDIVYGDRDGRQRVEKQPSIMLGGFRAYYPLEKPLEGVVGLTLVFPGPSMIEVSEIEVMGTMP
jgi:hypothetical protein